MSRASDAKKMMGYVRKPAHAECQRCRYFTFELKLPAWMEQENKDSKSGVVWDKTHEKAAGFWCVDGDFAVIKTSLCDRYRREP